MQIFCKIKKYLLKNMINFNKSKKAVISSIITKQKHNSYIT